MQNEFIPYEQALILKELGFNEPCLGTWVDQILDTTLQIPSDNPSYILAPLYQQVFRWFRENHNLIHVIRGGGGFGSNYMWRIHSNNAIYPGPSNTYEEAEIFCLNKLIDIVKNK